MGHGSPAAAANRCVHQPASRDARERASGLRRDELGGPSHAYAAIALRTNSSTLDAITKAEHVLAGVRIRPVG